MFARRLVSAHQARILEERARRMRFSPTRSEEWLWRRLSGSQTGFAFRRQLVIGNSSVDFACTKARLAVEVDGPSHEGRARPDARPDRVLASLGWRVLRIDEQLVFEDLDAVVALIVAHASSEAGDRRVPRRVHRPDAPRRGACDEADALTPGRGALRS